MTDTTEALVTYFRGEGHFRDYGLIRLAEYSWPIHPGFRAAYPEISEGDGYRPNVELKWALSRDWAKSDLDQRLDLVHKIIAVWGGIRSNRPDRFVVYRDLAITPPAQLPFAGVASYSKVLAIVEPDQYAIFDARVSAALSEISLVATPDKASIFPQLPSRNVAIKRFMEVKTPSRIVASHTNWQMVRRKGAYRDYLALLKSTLSHLPLGTTLCDLEMCLFSQAPRLVSYVDQKRA